LNSRRCSNHDASASGRADAYAKGQADAYAKAQADAYAKGYADGKNGYYNGESSTAK
jgi:flagellar biosynthesis/type III secretory pathway protein FliH